MWRDVSAIALIGLDMPAQRKDARMHIKLTKAAVDQNSNSNNPYGGKDFTFFYLHKQGRNDSAEARSRSHHFASRIVAVYETPSFR